MDMRFGTWNVRSMYRAGSLRAVGEEVLKETTGKTKTYVGGQYENGS
jgi:hypothetical protein